MTKPCKELFRCVMLEICPEKRPDEGWRIMGPREHVPDGSPGVIHYGYGTAVITKSHKVALTVTRAWRINTLRGWTYSPRGHVSFTAEYFAKGPWKGRV